MTFLKRSNDFLRNKVANININPFFGYKIKINENYLSKSIEFNSKENLQRNGYSDFKVITPFLLASFS